MRSHSRPALRAPTWRRTAAFALALLLAACGGGSPDGADAAPVPPPSTSLARKGFGPSQLYHPDTNPWGSVLRAGHTGVVFLPKANPADPANPSGPAERQIWFELAEATTYALELKDEDLANLARVQVADANGQRLLSIDAGQRRASVTLASGRYALHLLASPTNAETTPLFVRFADNPAEPPLALRARECVGCDLTSILLKDADLRGARLDHAILQASSLAGVNFGMLQQGSATMRASLKGANFWASDLTDARLDGADLSGATLEWSSLRRAKLDMANLSGANLEQAYLSGATLVAADLSGARLNSANLSRASLIRANLSRATLFKADLSRADLREAKLDGADLTGARLDGVIWF